MQRDITDHITCEIRSAISDRTQHFSDHQKMPQTVCACVVLTSRQEISWNDITSCACADRLRHYPMRCTILTEHRKHSFFFKAFFPSLGLLRKSVGFLLPLTSCWLYNLDVWWQGGLVSDLTLLGRGHTHAAGDPAALWLCTADVDHWVLTNWLPPAPSDCHPFTQYRSLPM